MNEKYIVFECNYYKPRKHDNMGPTIAEQKEVSDRPPLTVCIRSIAGVLFGMTIVKRT